MSPRRWAWLVWGVTLAVAFARPVIAAFDASSTEQIWEYAFLIGAVGASATVGALITSRQPGNRIGLLFATLAGAASISVTSGAYSSLATERGLALAGYAAWLSQLTFVITLYPLAFLFLLFPTGHVATPRWRWVLRVMLVAAAINVTLFALTPGVVGSGMVDSHDRIRNPIALPEAWREVVTGITEVAGIVVFVGGLLGVASLVLRFRRAGVEERQRIRWLAYLGVFLGVWFVTLISLELSGLTAAEGESVLANVGFFVFIIGLFFGVPATCAVAILRYRLYELDVVVRKTVVAIVLTALLGVLGILVIGVAGQVALWRGTSRIVGMLLGVLAGFLTWPLLRWARRIADRVTFGKRASAYEVLTEFGGRAAQTYATDDVMPRLAKVLAEGTGATAARVLLRVGGELREAAAWGDGDRADGGPAGGDEHVEPVVHQGEDLGALAVSMPANDPMDPSKEKLIRDLAAQAGLVLRNVRLIEELRASRQRLVAAQDEERRRIERNIHDGAQQQLVALNVRLGLARRSVRADPDAAEAAIEALQADVTSTLEDLRDLARGIYPPLLADQGLAAALEAQARKAAIPVDVHADGLGRFPREVESTVYFCTLEALNNVAKYAEATRADVRLANGAGELGFEVRDDGRGFDVEATPRGTGLQGIADRLDALGGRVRVESSPGEGTVVTGTVPTGGRS
jgi:signal transduction histidine kinase